MLNTMQTMREIAQPRSSCWSQESRERLLQFEQHRQLTIRATQRLFERFHDAHFRGNERVLEVGAGLGFLRRNWPRKFNGKWIESDEQPAFLEGRKNTIAASVYALPFGDRSFDVVCGFSSFDVFHDLEAALKEVYRVLKEGGIFLHLLDMHPCSTVAERWKQANKLPSVTHGWIDACGYANDTTVIYVPKERVAEFEKDEMAAGIDDFEALWGRYGQALDEHNVFQQDMIAAMRRFFRPEAVNAGKASAIFRGKRTGAQLEREGHFAFISDGYHTGSSCASMAIYYLAMVRNAGNMLRAFHPRNFFEPHRRFIYNAVKSISKQLGEKIEPDCTEFSQVHYALGRK